MKRALITIAVAFALTFSGASNATLISRLGGSAFYDTDLHITWMTDTAYQVTWQQAIDWVAAKNSSNHLGFSDWRLAGSINRQPFPQSCPTAAGWTGVTICSEISHLMNVELGISYASTVVPSNPWGFVGGQDFWTSDASFVDQQAYLLDSFFGYDAVLSIYKTQTIAHGVGIGAVAVRDGDVAGTVPTPATFALVALGFFALACSRNTPRRRIAKT